MVCYDGFFPEIARELSNRGAEVIAWPVWGCNPLLARAQIEVIRQARHLGDYESAEVLVALTRSARLTAEAEREYESAAEHLGDYSRKRVLSAVNR